MEAKRSIWSRRDFFTRLGWGGFGVFSLFALVGFLRSAFPRVLFELPKRFKLSDPKDFVLGEVNEKFTQEFQVWIVREETGLYALFAKCTHLGCTPRWLPAENKFKCPCHNSGFYKHGINFEDPAPRPLDRFEIMLGEDGQIVVDESRLFSMKPGTDLDDQYPQRILKV